MEDPVEQQPTPRSRSCAHLTLLTPPRLRTLLPQGLWRGTVPGLLLTVPYTAAQFAAHHHVKDAATKLGLIGECLRKHVE